MPAPIRLSEHFYALPLEAMMGAPTLIFPALIVDSVYGATLVDTGLPDMQGALAADLAELVLGWSDVKS